MLRFNELKSDRKLMSGIYIITLITALLILSLVIKGPEKSGILVADKDGNIVGIKRHRMDRNERYELSLEIEDEAHKSERDISLVLQSVNGKGNRVYDSDDREAEIDAGVNTLINSVEYSKKKNIRLPNKLPDGTTVIWKDNTEHSGNSMLIMIPVMYGALLAVMVGSRLKDNRGDEEERRSILKGLPRFCNQLFLMMNAGLILSDAFATITDSYALKNPKDLSLFEKGLTDIREAADGHRISTAYVINEYAVKHDVKELIRIAAILQENEKRGSDVIESLERESRYLWDERKTVARENGRMIDSKMSYPLGMLLILLIVITMAPALLNM